jgi:hypothetical protein
MANDDDPEPVATQAFEDLEALAERHPTLNDLLTTLSRLVPNPRGKTGWKFRTKQFEKRAKAAARKRASAARKLRKLAVQVEEWFPPTRVERPLFTFDPDDPALKVEEVRPTTDLEWAEDELGYAPLAEELRERASALDRIYDISTVDLIGDPALAVLVHAARLEGHYRPAVDAAWLRQRSQEIADQLNKNRTRTKGDWKQFDEAVKKDRDALMKRYRRYVEKVTTARVTKRTQHRRSKRRA